MLNRLSHIAFMVSIHADIFLLLFPGWFTTECRMHVGEVKIICGAHSD